LREFRLRVSDAMYDAILAAGAKLGEAAMRDRGRGTVCRKAVRYVLNQDHVPTGILDMPDCEYAQYRDFDDALQRAAGSNQ
jgi:hypothetical protein